MAAQWGDERRNVSQNRLGDQNIINQGNMRDVHYHMPHPAARAEAARDMLDPLPGPHFLVPFPENKRFVGREGILERLKNGLSEEDWLHSAVIVGLGGVGKTQAALQTAYHVKSQRG